MANFEISINVQDIIAQHQEIADKIEAAVKEGVYKLAIQAHYHVVEIAKSKLRSTKEDFSNAVTLTPDGENAWNVTVPKRMMWIEEGLPSNFDMIPGFLNSAKAKSGPNGKYLVIPFKHNKAPSQQTNVQAALGNIVKAELKKRNIAYGGIERHADGMPKTGKLHGNLGITGPPSMNPPKSGQEGPVGHPLAVHPKPPRQEGPSGRPYLAGLSIQQKMGPFKEGLAKKDMMTFRTVSSKSSGWKHPGMEKLDSLGLTYTWALEKWDSDILPGILKDLGI
jgi:hypothetical protein